MEDLSGSQLYDPKHSALKILDELATQIEKL